MPSYPITRKFHIAETKSLEAFSTRISANHRGLRTLEGLERVCRCMWRFSSFAEP